MSFTINDRNLVRARVLQLAAIDSRIVAGAAVGSLALGDGDRWSDLDLAFAVANDQPVPEVLEDWMGTLNRSSTRFNYLISQADLLSIGCSCCPAASSSISPSLPLPNSGPPARSSS